MRTLGEVMMTVAALALIAVALTAGYQPYFREWRGLLRSGDWQAYRSPNRLRFFDDHSVWIAFLPLFLVAGVGWVLSRYG
jgi:hypothetical protein